MSLLLFKNIKYSLKETISWRNMFWYLKSWSFLSKIGQNWKNSWRRTEWLSLSNGTITRYSSELSIKRKYICIDTLHNVENTNFHLWQARVQQNFSYIAHFHWFKRQKINWQIFLDIVRINYVYLLRVRFLYFWWNFKCLWKSRTIFGKKY